MGGCHCRNFNRKIPKMVESKIVTRSVDRRKYILAGVITLGIFLLGFLFGMVVENKRVDLGESIYKEQTVDFASSQLQFDYLSEFVSEENCGFAFDSYYNSLRELDRGSERLAEYSENERINEKEFILLRREYLLSEIKFWLLAKKIQSVCKVDMVPVLNFHSDDDECPRCGDQAFVLTYLKKKFGERVLIFSFSLKDIGEPAVSMLKTSHNITQIPTIVVNEIKFDGFTERNELEKEICNNLNDKKDCPEFKEK